VNYFLERDMTVTASPAFTPLATNILDQSDTTTPTLMPSEPGLFSIG
jgi:hypothetical protein